MSNEETVRLLDREATVAALKECLAEQAENAIRGLNALSCLTKRPINQITAAYLVACGVIAGRVAFVANLDKAKMTDELVETLRKNIDLGYEDAGK